MPAVVARTSGCDASGQPGPDQFRLPVARNRSSGPGVVCERGWLVGAANAGPLNICSVVKSQNQSSPGSYDCITRWPVS